MKGGTVPVSIADPQITSIGGNQEIRVHLREGGKGRVIHRGKGAKWPIHEVGDRGGLHHGQLSTQHSGSIVAHTNVVAQCSKIHWFARINCNGREGGREGG